MLSLDLNYAMNESLAPCAGMREIAPLGERVDRCLADLRAGGPLKGWVGLPFEDGPAAEAAAFARSLPEGLRDVAVLGIGGSSLGPLAVYHAARHPHVLRPAPGDERSRLLHFLDNSDPDTVGSILEGLDPATTLYIVITKSGSTAETASQLLIAWARASEVLGESARDHFVFITDPERGDLRALAGRLGVRTFSVPPDVGGRFSVLSPVGLVPTAAAGLDPAALIAGARRVAAACLDAPLADNPAALLAAIAHLADVREGRNVHVFMTYSDRLAPVGAWFRQIWAESLGKPRAGGPPAGPTPLDARGATDQHSLLQLLVQGPPDKFVVFLDVRSRREVTVPALFEDLPSFGYLAGLPLATLIDAERRGTAMSLARAGTPSITLTVDDTSPASMGALFFLLEVATAIAGSLYGVNPYDQPGVEQGKKLACGLLGRRGFEEMRAEARNLEDRRSDDLVIEF
ncbi:MAG: glucose-6-phosphate isomerase [Deltaproteobacteria bacterium]|nr:glucose-6-phosphate isomerase [Deltaproteobacteria bacterium]